MVRSQKSKIEFVWGENLMTLFPILPPIFTPSPLMHMVTCLGGCYRRQPEKYFYPLIWPLLPKNGDHWIFNDNQGLVIV